MQLLLRVLLLLLNHLGIHVPIISIHQSIVDNGFFTKVSSQWGSFNLLKLNFCFYRRYWSHLKWILFIRGLVWKFISHRVISFYWYLMHIFLLIAYWLLHCMLQWRKPCSNTATSNHILFICFLRMIHFINRNYWWNRVWKLILVLLWLVFVKKLVFLFNLGSWKQKWRPVNICVILLHFVFSYY